MQKILKSAMIITMNKNKEILNNACLVIDGTRIIDIGPNSIILEKYKDYEIIDCKEKVLIPGFINMHTHQTLSIIRGVAEDMGTAPAYTKSVPQGQELTEDESYVMATVGAMEALKFGSTYISDMYTYCQSNAKVFSKLGMRSCVSEMLHDMDFFSLYKHEYIRDEHLGDLLLERNIELIENWKGNPLVDVSLGLHAPDTCTINYIRKILDLSKKYKIKISTHLAQSRGELQRINQITGGKSSVQFYDDNGVLSEDLIAAHCIYVDEKDIQLLSERNVNVVHISEGNAKGAMAAPLNKFRKNNINVTLGTDNGSADMIEVMRTALCIGRVVSNSFEPYPMDLLEMATINGAKAIGRENELGSLEIGKLADVLIIDFKKPHMIPCLSPVGNLVHTGLGSDIETVIVNGEIVVQNGVCLKVDEEYFLREAQKIAEKKWLAVNNKINPNYFLKL